RPNARLLELMCRCVPLAASEDLTDISARMKDAPRWPDVWPGEHYKLLAALVRVLEPRTVIEIGTFQGLSALTLKKYLSPEGRLYTFDIVPWREVSGSALREGDFADDRL